MIKNDNKNKKCHSFRRWINYLYKKIMYKIFGFYKFKTIGALKKDKIFEEGIIKHMTSEVL